MSYKNSKDLIYLAELLDSKFKGPFGFRFGLDGIIGLIPGIGNALTTFVSLYIVVRSAVLGCSASVVVRMCLNIFIENLVGLIPVVGNIFDFVWKSNLKNLELIKKYEQNPTATHRSSFIIISGVIITTIMAIVGLLFMSFYVAIALFQWLLHGFGVVN